MAAFSICANAQDYSAPQVTISKDKVRSNGKIYYSHVVLEKQTLYSICKAYNVTMEALDAANPDLRLSTEGLKAGQILLVPITEGTAAADEAGADVKSSSESADRNAGTAGAENAGISGTNGAAEETSTGTGNAAENSSNETTVKGKADGNQAIGGTGKATQAQEAEREYFIHVVKWFEDLGSIASKFNVTADEIMALNSMSSTELKRKQRLKIPVRPGQSLNSADREATEEEYARLAQAAESETVTEEETEEGKPETEETKEEQGGFLFPGMNSRDADLGLVMPFNASGKRNSQLMDFYCGALMASSDAGENGTDVNLNVYDYSSGTPDAGMLERNSFVIGPVSPYDILKTAESCGSWIVSPLDTRAEDIADTLGNVISAPSSAKAQAKDMAEWIRQDFQHEDKLLVITQKGVSNEYSATITSALEASGLPMTSLSFTVLEGRNIQSRMQSLLTTNGSNRVVIASDNKSFVLEAIRNLYLLTSQNEHIILYGTSKIRSMDEIDIEQLHSLNFHVSLSYYVNYADKTVRDFVMRYRALFNAEPSQAAFQGYDVTSYFANLSTLSGRRWESAMEGWRGLQSDFSLRKTEKGGYINEAVRRIVYGKDYSVTLVK